MAKATIRTLNSVTKTLIDSCGGYQTCVEVSEEGDPLRQEFTRRQIERKELVSEFQNHVRRLGGEPADSGTLTGTVHRGFTKFSTLVRDGESAAIAALDVGEEFLSEKIDDKLEHTACDAESRALLEKAKESAVRGERLVTILSR